jgi:eukaryotic-like serine/threonine-protein kinase
MTQPDNNSMTCAEFDSNAFLEGRLPDGEESRWESHLGECGHCQAVLQEAAAEPCFWETAASSLSDRDSLDFSGSMHNLMNTFRVEPRDLAIESFLKAWLDPARLPEAIGALGKYDVLRIVGRGGMGLVLEASEPTLRRAIAIKVLLPHYLHDAAALQRFTREARLVASLRHPNILGIYDVERWHDIPYFVMPLVRGGTLKKYTAENSIDFEAILAILVQLIEGLTAAHAKGLVHRDLKPTNILLDDTINRLVISDFGLAKDLNETGFTRSEIVAGTPEFMSPEQARGEACDGRSDLFSLGSLVYWLCARRTPFASENSFLTLSKIVAEPHPSLRNIDPKFPGWFIAIVDWLLKKDRAERPQSAAELFGIVQQCMAHQGDAAALIPSTLRVADGKRFRKLAWYLAIALAAFGLFAFALMSVSRRSSTSPSIIEHPLTPQLQATPTANLIESTASLRQGPLDELDKQAFAADMKRNERQLYWLKRLAALSVQEIDADLLPAIINLADDSDPTIRELADVILNKNPFQEISTPASHTNNP